MNQISGVRSCISQYTLRCNDCFRCVVVIDISLMHASLSTNAEGSKFMTSYCFIALDGHYEGVLSLNIAGKHVRDRLLAQMHHVVVHVSRAAAGDQACRLMVSLL